MVVAVGLAASPKLAIPSFTGVRPDVASYCAERLADELGRAGFVVVTEKQIGALLGLERQLLGCSDQSSECLAELTNALGADALVSGSVSQLGQRLLLDVRVFSAKTGERLTVVHGEAEREDDIPSLLGRLTEELTPLVRSALGMTYEPARKRPGLSTWLPLGLAAASAIGGGVLLGLATSAHGSLTGKGSLAMPFTYEDAQSLARQEQELGNLGWALVSVAVLALVAGVVIWLVAR